MRTAPTGAASSSGFGGEGGDGGGSVIRTVCQSDVRKFCAGEEHVGRCLRRHDRELSDDCTAALRKQRENQ